MPVKAMEAQELVVVRGLRHTRETLARWNADPAPVLGSWFAGAALIAVGLLTAVWFVAAFVAPPDITRFIVAGINRPAQLSDVGHVLARNSLVLALHAFACVAGFIAGSSLPHEAQRYSGVWRWVHDKAGPLAIAFVIGATTFSLGTQAFVLGSAAATLSNQLDISNFELILGLTPHALPELTALFLPLAAWIIASRQDQWHELLAATFVTVAFAIPILVASAFVEVYVSPRLLLDMAGL